MRIIKVTRDGLEGKILGNENLKIGELAAVTGITKRTIDYYTNLGLLHAKRSTSNYRFYHSNSIDRIHEIEEMKSRGMTLQQIKQHYDKTNLKHEETELQEIRTHMLSLQKEVSNLLNKIEHEEQSKRESIKNKFSSEGVALMQSLQLLIT